MGQCRSSWTATKQMIYGRRSCFTALAVTRECLQIFARYPIGRLVLQIRSPRVVELLPELKALSSRVVVSVTVESDTDAIWEAVEPPMLPR